MATVTQSDLYQQSGQSRHDLPCFRSASDLRTTERRYDEIIADLRRQINELIEVDDDGEVESMELTADIPLEADGCPWEFDGESADGRIRWQAEWDTEQQIKHRSPAEVGQVYSATDRWVRVVYHVYQGE